MDWKLAGGVCFGAVIGWYLYFINRYRKGDVSIGDITTVIGAIGGAAVVAIYNKDTDVFGAYGVGLATGFFGYFISLVFLVSRSKEAFTTDWFLDGRRKNPPESWGYAPDTRQVVSPMAFNPNPPTPQGGMGQFHGVNPGATQNFYLTPVPAGMASLQVPKGELLAASAINPNAQRVIDACEATWPLKKTACNFFVIEVANRLGITLSGTADDIVANQLSSSGWTALGDGPAARAKALTGKLVIAGMKSSEFTHPRDEGHVAIVVPGDMNPGGWAPAGYWGSTSPDVASEGGSGKPISLCFRAEDKAKIHYAAWDI